ncbi:unnamed protein product [Durusdinium trenchii]|uniref:Uncharacterized protein n=2 Tax=Durusdinium trenchii TaxID=1381693 RepID=A0ABP0NSX8_9DINO
MLSNALNALASKSTQQGKPSKHIFPPTRLGSLAAGLRSQNDFEQGFEAEFATSGFTRPLGFEVRDASHVEGAFEASFGLEEADTVERTEVGLDATSRVLIAQLSDLPEDEFTEAVGRFGEEVALKVLKQRGFDIIWVNQYAETGLPFDFLVRPSSTCSFPPAMAKLCSTKSEEEVPSLQMIEAGALVNSIFGGGQDKSHIKCSHLRHQPNAVVHGQMPGQALLARSGEESV